MPKGQGQRGNLSGKRGQGPKDFNQIAFEVVQKAIGAMPKEEPPDPNKNPKAVTLGRMGGLKGGKARAEKLTAEQKKAIARKAADARWGAIYPTQLKTSPEHPRQAVVVNQAGSDSVHKNKRDK
jgi:hypothetical protein